MIKAVKKKICLLGCCCGATTIEREVNAALLRWYLT